MVSRDNFEGQGVSAESALPAAEQMSGEVSGADSHISPVDSSEMARGEEPPVGGGLGEEPGDVADTTQRMEEEGENKYVCVL